MKANITGGSSDEPLPCSTGLDPFQLDPGRAAPCLNDATETVFGDPYCKSCADNLRAAHAEVCKHNTDPLT